MNLSDTCTLGELYVRAVQRYGEGIAILDEDETLTYRALGDRIARYAQAFRNAGLKRGDGIAQLSANRVDAVAAIGAAFVCGLRYTPLNARASEVDHAFILKDSEVSAVILDESAFKDSVGRFKGVLGSQGRIFTFGKAEGALSLRQAIGDKSPTSLAVDADPQDIAFVVYTGGTTGRPKGVVHKHRSLLALLLIELAEFEWPEETRFLAATPISHAAFAFILPVLLKGGVLVLQRSFSPQNFFADVLRHRVTATFLVPSMITALLHSPEMTAADVSSLKMLVYGAAPMAPARLVEGIQRFGPIFVQLYGQAEAPAVITVLRRADHDVNRSDRLMSCGAPTIGTQVRLLDDNGHEVAPGEPGELCVRGPLVMEGYWNRPQETAEAFAGGWLHTGDVARRDAEGYLTIVDRKKDMIVSGGFNVFPREVEDALTAHPAVLQACVIGIPDPKWGEAVKAVVVRRGGVPVAAEELTQWVRERKGAVYAPKVLEFVETIPLTTIGKPDRKALRAPYWQGRDRQVG